MLNLVLSCSVPNGAVSRAIFRWNKKPNKPKRPLRGELINLGARFVIAGTGANYVLAGARQDTTALRLIKID
jgi:hypothetical protein